MHHLIDTRYYNSNRHDRNFSMKYASNSHSNNSIITTWEALVIFQQLHVMEWTRTVFG